MNFSSARSERITAILSTIVAVAILAGGVTAYQSHHAPVDDVVQLESDFRFQLEVGFKHDTPERVERLKQLQAVTAAWRQSPQSELDRQKLADWLLEATVRSMPGSVEELPPVPNFGATQSEPIEVEQPALGDQSEDLAPEINLSETTEDILVEPSVEDDTFEPTNTPPTPATPPQASTPAEPQPTATQLSAQPSEPVSPPVTTTEPTSEPAIVESLPEPVKVAPLPPAVNLSELAARIAGYQQGLRELEQALAKIEAGDFEALAKQLSQLEDLIDDYRFVSLYYQSLTPSERRWVQPPRTLTNTLVTFQRRIDQTQAAQSGDFLGEFDTLHAERIGQLRQQLADLSSVVSR